MQRFSLRFAIVLLTFVVGVFATTVWYAIHPRFSRSVEEANIMEAVFRYQIAESRSLGYTTFLLRSEEISNSNDDFMYRFVKIPGVRKFSHCSKLGYDNTGTETAEHEIILDVRSIEWVSNSEVEIGVATNAWGQTESVCRVVHENDTWLVKECQLTSITAI